MYGKTNYGRLSTFIKEEVPRTLILEDMPKRPPVRNPYIYQNAGYQNKSYQNAGTQRKQYYDDASREFMRRAEINTPPKQKSGPTGYGVEKIPVGARVSHAVFGEGVILSSRDMGGDVLYEVKFDTGIVKKLMATFAKLKKI